MCNESNGWQAAGVTGEECTCRPRVCVLGSRSQQCVHPTVSRLPGDALNQACRSMAPKRSCPWCDPSTRAKRAASTLTVHTDCAKF